MELQVLFHTFLKIEMLFWKCFYRMVFCSVDSEYYEKIKLLNF